MFIKINDNLYDMISDENERLLGHIYKSLTKNQWVFLTKLDAQVMFTPRELLSIIDKIYDLSAEENQ